MSPLPFKLSSSLEMSDNDEKSHRMSSALKGVCSWLPEDL